MDYSTISANASAVNAIKDTIKNSLVAQGIDRSQIKSVTLMAGSIVAVVQMKAWGDALADTQAVLDDTSKTSAFTASILSGLSDDPTVSDLATGSIAVAAPTVVSDVTTTTPAMTPTGAADFAAPMAYCSKIAMVVVSAVIAFAAV